MVGIAVIIPVFNEAEAITRVIADIPQKLVGEVARLEKIDKSRIIWLNQSKGAGLECWALGRL